MSCRGWLIPLRKLMWQAVGISVVKCHVYLVSLPRYLTWLMVNLCHACAGYSLTFTNHGELLELR